MANLNKYIIKFLSNYFRLNYYCPDHSNKILNVYKIYRNLTIL